MGTGAAGLPSPARLLWPGGGGSWSPRPSPGQPGCAWEQCPWGRAPAARGPPPPQAPPAPGGRVPPCGTRLLAGTPIVQTDTERLEGPGAAAQHVPAWLPVGSVWVLSHLSRGRSDRVPGPFRNKQNRHLETARWALEAFGALDTARQQPPPVCEPAGRGGLVGLDRGPLCRTLQGQCFWREGRGHRSQPGRDTRVHLGMEKAS